MGVEQMKNSWWNKLREEPEEGRQINTVYGIIIVTLIFISLVYIPFVLFKHAAYMPRMGWRIIRPDSTADNCICLRL